MADLDQTLEPWTKIPPLEEYNRPFILGYKLGNGKETEINFVVAHGTLANGIHQANTFACHGQTDSAYKASVTF